MQVKVKVMQVVTRSGWSEVELQVVPEPGGAFTRGLFKGAIESPEALAQVKQNGTLLLELSAPPAPAPAPVPVKEDPQQP